MSNLIRGRMETTDENLQPLVIPVPHLDKVHHLPSALVDGSDDRADIEESAHASALRIVEAAKQEAEQLIEQARRESQEIFEEARRDGFEQGREQAEQEYRALSTRLEEEHARAMEGVRQLAEQVGDEREQIIRTALRPLSGICMEVVRDVLGRELELAPANIERLVQELIQYVVDGSRVEVRVSPSDYGLAQAAHPVWRGAKYGEWELVVIPDQSVAPGGCQVRSDVGNIDATVEVKLDMMREALDRAFAGGEVERVDSLTDVDSLG